MKFFIVLFFISFSCYAQITNIAKDTLQLEQVTITKNTIKQKTKRVTIEGVCSSPDDMKDAMEIITLVDNLPKGKLGSVNFYFNKVDAESYSLNKKHFKEADFEVVLYDVNDEDMPGILSAVDREYMVVDKAHRGKITVDLSYLNIETNKKMFIGIRKLSANDDKSFLVDCLCSGRDKYTTYYKENASSTWRQRWVCAAIKMDVSVVVPNK